MPLQETPRGVAGLETVGADIQPEAGARLCAPPIDQRFETVDHLRRATAGENHSPTGLGKRTGVYARPHAECGFGSLRADLQRRDHIRVDPLAGNRQA
jgi:hypothetical protein